MRLRSKLYKIVHLCSHSEIKLSDISFFNSSLPPLSTIYSDFKHEVSLSQSNKEINYIIRQFPMRSAPL